jgi:hypothetical protein
MSTTAWVVARVEREVVPPRVAEAAAAIRALVALIDDAAADVSDRVTELESALALPGHGTSTDE